MKITDIPSNIIDLVTKLNCHEFAIGVTIPSNIAIKLSNVLDDWLLYTMDEDMSTWEISDRKGLISCVDIYDSLNNIRNILEELSDDSIDRLTMTYNYRNEYNNIIEKIFSDTTFDELSIDDVTHLNFIPTNNGWILPVCFRVIYDDNLEVYHRYTDEYKLFKEVKYTEHDGTLFDYYYKPNM